MSDNVYQLFADEKVVSSDDLADEIGKVVNELIGELNALMEQTDIPDKEENK